jgi:RNA polymerase sigma factor (sigma-70 family)
MFEVKIDFQKLARRLRARDEDAYEFVIESYRRRIICYLLKKGVPYEEAKDIASDCISKLWETACEGYDPKLSLFWTWLRTLALNLAIDRGRKNVGVKLVTLDEASQVVDPKSVDEKYGGEYDWELVERAIDTLNINDQEVIKFKLDGLTYEEMSKIFGSSPTAAGMRVVRAVERLRSAVERLNNNGPRGPN